MEKTRTTARERIRRIAVSAMIAALYTALCVALAPFSFGAVQVRVAEALAILAVFSPLSVWGLTLGCALSNLIGFLTGMNLLGFLDVAFGTAATLLAALASRGLRRIHFGGLPVLAALPPVIFNAVVVGAELGWVTMGAEGFAAAFWLSALSVGAGQLIACVGLGLPLYALLSRTGAARVCFGEAG